MDHPSLEDFEAGFHQSWILGCDFQSLSACHTTRNLRIWIFSRNTIEMRNVRTQSGINVKIAAQIVLKKRDTTCGTIFLKI